MKQTLNLDHSRISNSKQIPSCNIDYHSITGGGNTTLILFHTQYNETRDQDYTGEDKEEKHCSSVEQSVNIHSICEFLCQFFFFLGIRVGIVDFFKLEIRSLPLQFVNLLNQILQASNDQSNHLVRNNGFGLSC